MKVFLTHPKSWNDDEIVRWSALVKEQFASEDLEVEVVPGRDDFRDAFVVAGSWETWCQDVVDRHDLDTGEPVYGAFILPASEHPKAATIRIVNAALAASRPVIMISDRGDPPKRLSAPIS